MSNNQTIRFYVSVINKNTGEKQHVQKLGRSGFIFNTTQDLSESNAYDNAEDAGMVVNHLNAIMEHFNHANYYYVTQTINDNQVWTAGMPDNVKKWFEEDEEELPKGDE